MSKIFTSKNYQNLINKKVGTNTPFSKLFKDLRCQIFPLWLRDQVLDRIMRIMRINAGLDGFWIVMVRISYGHCHNRTTVLSLLTLKPAQSTLNDLLQRLMMDNYFSIQEYLQYLPVILV